MDAVKEAATDRCQRLHRRPPFFRYLARLSLRVAITGLLSAEVFGVHAAAAAKVGLRLRTGFARSLMIGEMFRVFFSCLIVDTKRASTALECLGK